MTGERRSGEDEAPTAPFVAAQIRALDAALGKAEKRVRAKEDGEAVHDMRVAIRRLRTMLRLCRPLYGRFLADAVRTAFSDFQSCTSDLRDEEALAETLEALPVHDAAFDAWRAARRTREKRLRGAVLSRLRRGDLLRARRMLKALTALPVKPARDEPLGHFARRAVRQARKKVDRMRDVPTSDPEEMHALRIRYKELRYAAELFAPALPFDLAALAAPAARFQKRLGDIHDIDRALEAIARARTLPPGTRAAVAAALAEARARRTKKYLSDMAPARAEDHLAKTDATPPAATSQAVGGVGLRKISTF